MRLTTPRPIRKATMVSLLSNEVFPRLMRLSPLSEGGSSCLMRVIAQSMPEIQKPHSRPAQSAIKSGIPDPATSIAVPRHTRGAHSSSWNDHAFSAGQKRLIIHGYCKNFFPTRHAWPLELTGTKNTPFRFTSFHNNVVFSPRPLSDLAYLSRQRSPAFYYGFMTSLSHFSGIPHRSPAGILHREKTDTTGTILGKRTALKQLSTVTLPVPGIEFA